LAGVQHERPGAAIAAARVGRPATAIALLLTALASAFLIAATMAGRAQPFTPRPIPPEYKTVGELLEFLKPTKESASGFDVKVAPSWDVARLMGYLSKGGILFSDVNRGAKVQKLSPQQVRAQVAKRRGAAFTALAHVGYIYAQPYKQYSELTFKPRADGVVVHLAEWYRLTFAREAGELKLIRIDYLMLEGG
jgi:hypothetical protein